MGALMLLAIPSPRASAPQLPAPESDVTGSFAKLSMSLARRFVSTPMIWRKRMAAAQIRLSAAHCNVKTLPASHCTHLQGFPPRVAPERPSRVPTVSSACVRAPCFFLGLAGLSAPRRTQSALTWPSMEGMFHPWKLPPAAPPARPGLPLPVEDGHTDLPSAPLGVQARQRWVVES